MITLAAIGIVMCLNESQLFRAPRPPAQAAA